MKEKRQKLRKSNFGIISLNKIDKSLIRLRGGERENKLTRWVIKEGPSLTDSTLIKRITREYYDKFDS